jgi:hypothetical protein
MKIKQKEGKLVKKKLNKAQKMEILLDTDQLTIVFRTELYVNKSRAQSTAETQTTE